LVSRDIVLFKQTVNILKEAIVGLRSAGGNAKRNTLGPNLLCQIVMQSKFIPLLNGFLQPSIHPHVLERFKVFHGESLSVIEVPIESDEGKVNLRKKNPLATRIPVRDATSPN
jgi:hypothetical protein